MGYPASSLGRLVCPVYVSDWSSSVDLESARDP